MTTGADSPLNADQLSCDVAIVGGGEGATLREVIDLDHNAIW